MITLCFDFGNTNKKVAVFKKDKLIEQFYLADDNAETIEKLVQETKANRSILSSVVRHNAEVEIVLQDLTSYHKLSAATKLNFTTPVGKPESIGADRLALVSAAVHFYPGRHNLVIGMGSCITYNYITPNAEFVGGSISPGMDMRFKAMHEHTALLPLVSADWTIPLIGYDTKTNLQSGVVYGIIAELDGLIDQYQQRFGNFNAVLTGGNSAFFAGQVKNRIFADHNFLYKGLYALSQINCP